MLGAISGSSSIWCTSVFLLLFLASLAPCRGGSHPPEATRNPLVTRLRRYPILQTSAFHRKTFMAAMGLESTGDMRHFFTREAAGIATVPYHYHHLEPEKVFLRFENTSWECSNTHDCILNFNAWDVNGVPGVLYTQTGLQSSLASTGWLQTDHLKWYKLYVRGPDDPDVCEAVKRFGITPHHIAELRALIKKEQARLSMTGMVAYGKMKTNLTQGQDGWSDGEEEGEEKGAGRAER